MPPRPLRDAPLALVRNRHYHCDYGHEGASALSLISDFRGTRSIGPARDDALEYPSRTPRIIRRVRI